MKIITISREFGSGGRELGKRLADLMNWDYYDKENIAAIAGKKNMDEGYVSRVLEDHGWKNIPLSFRNSFGTAASSMQTALLVEQKQVIEEIAKAGKDFVIVGRNADVLLKEYQPFSVFVCADMAVKVRRCMERAEGNEQLSYKERYAVSIKTVPMPVKFLQKVNGETGRHIIWWSIRQNGI